MSAFIPHKQKIAALATAVKKLGRRVPREDLEVALADFLRPWRQAETGRTTVVLGDGSCQLLDWNERRTASYSDVLDAAAAIESDTIEWTPMPKAKVPSECRSKAAPKRCA